MKKLFTLSLIAVILLSLLTGCGCSHQWTEASCTAARTCSKCGEIEGEALGHNWTEATCAAAKTCTRCGETEGSMLMHSWTDASCAAPQTCTACGATEGEVLPHIWMEANYQQPQTCSVCSKQEGAPLTPSFVEMGYEIDVTEVGTPVTMTVAGTEYAFRVDSYDIYSSDDTHEALEGYEWRSVSISVEALENQSALGRNIKLYPDYDEYYDSQKFNDTLEVVPGSALVSICHTVNYLGTDYSDCLFQLDNDQLDANGDTWIFRNRMSFRVPTGYDGILVSVGDGTKMTGDYQTQRKAFYSDENTVIFRLQ